MFDFCSINCGLNCRNEFGRRMVQQEFDSPSHEFGSHGQFNGPSSPISVLNQPLTKKQKEIPEKNSKNSKKKKNNNKSLNSNFNRRAEATAATKKKKKENGGGHRPIFWFHDFMLIIIYAAILCTIYILSFYHFPYLPLLLFLFLVHWLYSNCLPHYPVTP